MITLYTTHCPKCEVLKMKLDAANIQFQTVDDEEVMASIGMLSAPMLQVDDQLLDFSQAITWVRQYG